jgi:hypothetical protein
MNRPARIRLLAGATVALLLGVASPALSQRTLVGSEPTVCPPAFTPISGLTFHAGYAWSVMWTTSPGQIGSARYGGPASVTSTDGNAVWSLPGLLAECTIDWYRLPNGHHDAYFHWHVVMYFGRVTRALDCTTDDEFDLASNSPSYDPFDPAGAGCGEGGGSGDGATADLTCHTEYAFIEISTDGGVTWMVWWEGFVEVCQ